MNCEEAEKRNAPKNRQVNRVSAGWAVTKERKTKTGSKASRHTVGRCRMQPRVYSL